MTLKNNNHVKDAEKLSQRLLYVLVGLTAVVFGAFYLIGFDRPSFDDTGSNDPLLTGLLLSFILLLLAGALSVGVWASLRGLIMKRRESNMMISSGNRPFLLSSMGISVIVASLTAVALVAFFLIGSSSEMMINGEPFTDTFWLKMSDMFINTSLLMLVVAVGTMIFGATRYYRKGGQ